MSFIADIPGTGIFVDNIHWTKTSVIATGDQATLDATCPLLEDVNSSGVRSTHKGLVMTTSRPYDNTRWRTTGINTGATTMNPTMTVRALCADPGTTVTPIVP